MAADAVPLVVVSALCSVAAALAAAHCLLRRRGAWPLAALAMAWTGAWSASVLAVLAGLQLPAAYRSFLSMWRLDGLTVPVWVGEIGTWPGDTSPLWLLLWECVHPLDKDPHPATLMPPLPCHRVLDMHPNYALILITSC